MKELKERKYKKLNFILSIIIVISLFAFSLCDNVPETNSAENIKNTVTNNPTNENTISNASTETNTNTNVNSDASINTNNNEKVNTENKTPEEPKKEEPKKQEDQLDIQKRIEDKIAESLGKNEEKIDILNKYKDFNLTEEVEKDYESYQDDKNGDYYDNMDDLDKDDKYNNKKKKRSKKEIEEEKYNSEWDEKVSKMHAHDLLTVKVNKKDYEIFYEEIEQVPVTITAAFYLHEEKSKMDFEILNPKKKTIFKLKSKNRGFYEFEVKEPGRYEFYLSNERVHITQI